MSTSAFMTKGAKLALRHAANAIDGARTGDGVRLGASRDVSVVCTHDRHYRPFASVYLARRAGLAPGGQADAQRLVSQQFGLSIEQAEKLDLVAASTHNIVQRGERVANFIRKVVEDPSYLGRKSKDMTGAVAASL